MLFLVGMTFGLAFFVIAMGAEVGGAGDTPVYVELSRGVFSFRGFQLGGAASATYPPGYPLFLAPFTALTGGAGAEVVVVQCALGGLCAVMTARIGDLLYSTRVGGVAGIAAALAPQLAFWEAYPISDVLGLTLLLAGTVQLFRAAPARTQDSDPPLGPAISYRRAAVAGALFGASALVRPLSLSLAIPALFWLANRSISVSWRERAGLFAVVVAVMIALMAPWTVRNAVEFGGFYPLSTRNGWQLVQATQWELHGRGTVGVDVTYPEEAAGLTEGEADRLLTRLALDQIRSHPYDFLRRSGTKSLFTWLPTAPGLGYGSLMMGIQFCLVALAAALAMLYRRGRSGGVLWLMSLGATLGIALTILDPDYRYRLPILLVLMPAAAWLLLEILGFGGSGLPLDEAALKPDGESGGRAATG